MEERNNTCEGMAHCRGFLTACDTAEGLLSRGAKMACSLASAPASRRCTVVDVPRHPFPLYCQLSLGRNRIAEQAISDWVHALASIVLRTESKTAPRAPEFADDAAQVVLLRLTLPGKPAAILNRLQIRNPFLEGVRAFATGNADLVPADLAEADRIFHAYVVRSVKNAAIDEIRRVARGRRAAEAAQQARSVSVAHEPSVTPDLVFEALELAIQRVLESGKRNLQTFQTDFAQVLALQFGDLTMKELIARELGIERKLESPSRPEKPETEENRLKRCCNRVYKRRQRVRDTLMKAVDILEAEQILDGQEAELARQTISVLKERRTEAAKPASTSKRKGHAGTRRAVARG